MSIDSQIMAPCPGCGMVLPTDLVACTDCLATLPDILREQWAQVTGRHHDKTAAYLDARKAVQVWFRLKAEVGQLHDALDRAVELVEQLRMDVGSERPLITPQQIVAWEASWQARRG